VKKVRIWSVSICAAATGLALTIPGAATAAPSAPGGVKIAAPAFPGRLYGVAAVNARDIWAVGLDQLGSMAQNWNGSRWRGYHPTPGSGFFDGVAQSAARDVWAVGGTNWFSPSQPLAEHWNGRSWTRATAQNPAGGGYFNAATATSASNAWAVGLVGPGPGVPSPTAPLIERWNGRGWTIQHLQGPATGGQLDGVQALSPSNAWAVGWTGGSGGGGQRTLIEHWNGRTWTRVPSPVIGVQSFLHSVTVISSANAWAVGSYQAADGTNKTLSVHWDGRHWTVVPSVTPGGDAEFIGVAASWTHNIWAVGITNPARCGNGGPKCQTLIEHWNSVRWKVIPSPNPPSGYLNTLLGVTPVNRGDIWAVGSTDFASTIIVHWNGTSWS
jgi:hypothetical protein